MVLRRRRGGFHKRFVAAIMPILSYLPFFLDATALDVWVLDHLRELFTNATTDAVLDSHLRSDKVVFFLHLLGLDTTGHSYRPHSRVSETPLLPPID